MRSYALLILALAVLHARAASIPAPVEAEKKLPSENEALDNVSLDNNASEQELLEQTNTVKDVENNLRKSIPVENVPVKVIEEQPVVKIINENSNDYVPDNDDSLLIKRVEIDLKNPGPPQRQEHDSQNPGYHVDQQKALIASIAESSKVFNKGIQDVAQQFKTYFANDKNEDLNVVQEKIQFLKTSVNAQVKKLSETVNSCLKVQSDDAKDSTVQLKKITEIKEVENSLNNLEKNFNTGVNMLSEGVELLSILKEEDEAEKPLKISGKADNENAAGESLAPQPANPAPSSTTAAPSPANPVMDFVQNFQNQMSSMFTSMTNTVTTIFNPNQNQNSTSTNTSNNPFTFLQNIIAPSTVQNQNQGQAQETPAAAQADDPSTTTTAAPNVLQQISNGWNNLFNQGSNQQQPAQQNPNPILQAIQNRPLFSLISSLTQGVSGTQNQQNSQAVNTVVNQPAADKPVAPAPVAVAGPPAPAAQGTNVVPAPAPQADPPKPAKETQPVENQVGPIQQIVQNNPIVQGITHAVQRIQGLSNPSKPRDTPVPENPDPKGHRPGNTATAGDNNDSNGIVKNEPVKEEQQTIPEIKNDKPETEPVLNKTE